MLQIGGICLVDYKNNVVKDSLTEALLLLMETTEYSQITITNIAKKAGVSRMAYYRNFDTKEEILIYYFDRSCHDLYINTHVSTHLPLIHRTVQHIYTLFIEKKAVISALKKANLTSILLDYFDKIVITGSKIILKQNNKVILPPESMYHNFFISGALYNFFMKWFDSGMNESYEEIMEIVTHHMHHIIETATREMPFTK